MKNCHVKSGEAEAGVGTAFDGGHDDSMRFVSAGIHTPHHTTPHRTTLVLGEGWKMASGLLKLGMRLGWSALEARLTASRP